MKSTINLFNGLFSGDKLEKRFKILEAMLKKFGLMKLFHHFDRIKRNSFLSIHREPMRRRDQKFT